MSYPVISVAVVSTTYEVPDAAEQAGDRDEFDAALELFAAGVDALFALDLTGFSDARVEDGFRRYMTEARCLAGVQNVFVAELIDRCLPAARRAGSTGMYLRSLVRTSIGEGRAWERDAIDLVGARSLSSGEALPPRYPAVAAAVNAGTISTTHARLITDMLRSAPTTVRVDERARAEAKLVAYAREHDPAALRNRCVEMAEELDPDGSLGSTREERDRARSFHLGKQDRHGMYPVKGRLDPECGALLQAAISPLAAPVPGPDGERDPRTTEQRNHDAVADLARRALAGGTAAGSDLPVRHGLPGKLIVKIGLDQLEARTGCASTIHGGRLPARDLLRLAVDMGVIPVVLDADGQILHFGEEQRLATPELRLAAWVLDGGCTFQACSVPAVWCQGAHGVPFRTSKQTTIDDLGLLCGYHHRVVDNQEWTMRRVKHRIWLTPPKWIDPDQTPRTNEHFHPLRT